MSKYVVLVDSFGYITPGGPRYEGRGAVVELDQGQADRGLALNAIREATGDETDATRVTTAPLPPGAVGPPAGPVLTAETVAEMNADEVVAYVEQHPDQRDTVLELERAGKNRKTVVQELSGGQG